MIRTLLVSTKPPPITVQSVQSRQTGRWSGVDSIRRIQYLGYGVLGVSWSRDHAQIRRIFLDGYGVLVVRTVIFKISSFKLHNACLLVKFHQTLFDVINDVQPNYVVDSDAEYTSDSNIIPYEQYVKDNIAAQFVSANEHNKVVYESLTVELARYTEQVELYEKRSRFELTEREQKIDEKLRIIITDHDYKEESLKKELHSVKMQLHSTINHNKSMIEEVTTLKKDFKQKENKYLEDFLDMKALKEKVKDKLFKQDQSFQTSRSIMRPLLCMTHDTLELAEITRKRMLEKVKTPLCVEKRVKIAPPDYSKENYLATFTPQRHLIPEHIFWSLEIQCLTAKPMSKMTVYPPNTPTKLVPRVLPTKSQVKINIYTLTQLFTEFDKTCKKRITPCGLTEGERGFEQTKECYLTKVIPFFKTLKEHFEGIQTALVKEMKEIFEQMEAEVEQNDVDKQCADIEKKNLLIENENLIANCLSTELLYSIMNDVNNVSRFPELHDAYTVEQARVVDHEAEISIKTQD
ncbi:hypothetical protein Tco_0870119 [Tanacetum coccineum]